jgi:tRNA threonylcarbamoyladenosine biosynthesis protein TsaE
LYLYGDLGAGKTTLVRALLTALGYAGRVKSPSYTLLEPYSISRLNLHHFDFYRLNDPSEWDEAGFRESFAGETICLVEWPEKAGGRLPLADLDIEIFFAKSGRDLRVQAHSDLGTQCVSTLRSLANSS